MKAASTSMRDVGHDVRVAHYPGHQALHIVDDLVLVEAMSGASVGDDTSAWMRVALAEPGFHLVTVSAAGRLAGFIAANVADGHLHVRQVTVTPAAAGQRPDLYATLIDELIDATDMPWLDVVIDRDCPATGHLLSNGWRAAADDGTGPVVTLSAAVEVTV